MKLRSDVPKEILILLALAIVLTLVRVAIFDSYSFVYLLWNIFLAMLPFIISSLILLNIEHRKGKKVFIALGLLAWFILLPNAPYIVTDLIHVGRGYTVRALYDSFLLFTCAWVGLILGFYSLSHMEKMIRMKYSPKKTEIIIGLILLFSSFGIYLGRFLRFNSWDVFADPINLWYKVSHILANPGVNSIVYAYTILFFVFLYASYHAWKFSRINKS